MIPKQTWDTENSSAAFATENPKALTQAASETLLRLIPVSGVQL